MYSVCMVKIRSSRCDKAEPLRKSWLCQGYCIPTGAKICRRAVWYARHPTHRSTNSLSVPYMFERSSYYSNFEVDVIFNRCTTGWFHAGQKPVASGWMKPAPGFSWISGVIPAFNSRKEKFLKSIGVLLFVFVFLLHTSRNPIGSPTPSFWHRLFTCQFARYSGKHMFALYTVSCTRDLPLRRWLWNSSPRWEDHRPGRRRSLAGWCHAMPGLFDSMPIQCGAIHTPGWCEVCGLYKKVGNFLDLGRIQ